MSEPKSDAYHKISVPPPKEPSGCPFNHEFTPFDPDYLTNPYPQLEKLSEEGKRAAPPTVYRALDFLIDAGLVHRLDSLNAFIGCPDPERSHAGQFLICRQCRTVAELDDSDIDELVGAKAAEFGFTAVHQMLEIGAGV